jgi:hypothetical protein
MAEGGDTRGKRNCWEFKNCGREPGGKKVLELGICPAATEGKLDGVHGGRRGGRACWVVAGTYCKGEVQGTFAAKFGNCRECEFYQLVQREEDHDFTYSSVLLAKLGK